MECTSGACWHWLAFPPSTSSLSMDHLLTLSHHALYSMSFLPPLTFDTPAHTPGFFLLSQDMLDGRWEILPACLDLGSRFRSQLVLS